MEKFDIVAGPESNALGLYRLKRARRRDKKSRVGDIVPLANIRTDIEVVPQFGSPKDVIPGNLTSHTSMKWSSSFYLNHHCDAEVFYMFYDIFRVPEGN
jgi:hypothetical protein